MNASREVDRQVRLRAGDRCEYCHMHQSLQGATFHVEHVIPRSRGGQARLDNLAWACPGCNLRKSDRVEIVDPESGELVPFFDPREHVWGDLGGSSRPNSRFGELCRLAGIEPKTDGETGEERAWMLKDLRKTCATYYDEHIPESSIEILGHAVGGITYRHYAHRAPLAFKAITTLPQPTAFSALVRGYDGQCPCCRRAFADAT